MGNKSTMESMVTWQQYQQFFVNKKVLLTGHTGFKGAWLLQILARCGAQVTGLALAPQKKSDLYNQIDGDRLCHSIIQDIRNQNEVKKIIHSVQPDIIFHLAAQPLVWTGYDQPIYTYEVNTMGTAYILDALRDLTNPCIAIMITTDKVYENLDQSVLFTESHKLGGYDPYSASKAACEIVISSYRNAYFNPTHYATHQKVIVSMRAGNVIGGGDYADNRIIPDIIQAIQQNEPVVLRNPHATRPWQHVLEPLGAYMLAAYHAAQFPETTATAFNIGPEKVDELSVQQLTEIAIQTLGKGSYQIIPQPKLHEAATLMLDNSKIKQILGWQPLMNARQAIQQTVQWYLLNEDAAVKCLREINDYFNPEKNDTHD